MDDSGGYDDMVQEHESIVQDVVVVSVVRQERRTGMARYEEGGRVLTFVE